MVVERRVAILVAGVATFFLLVGLWHAFAPRPGPPPPPIAPAPLAAPAPTAPTPGADTTKPRAAAETARIRAPAPDPGLAGTSYMVLLARSEARRRIRASAGLTYLSEIVAEGQDSMLHRWDDRVQRPVRVFLPSGTAANFQPAFLDAVRQAFQRWEDAGVPVRFNLDADSDAAEVRFLWRIQVEAERTGETNVQWDADGHLVSGIVTLATFDPNGQPLNADDIRVVALHEIGHLIGLDHSPDSSDVMFARTKVRDLSSRDIQTALLLYQLAPGSLR